jgi:tripartite-type tricarboxylate transporter receptor subunit TctC
MQRRHFVRTTLAVAMFAASAAAMAQTYPAKPVTMIIPFPPGGTLDTVGRMLAQKLGQQMGQTFIVDNRPGGLGTIGGSAVKQAKPDGYTMLFAPSTHVTTPMAMKSAPYDPVKDFTPRRWSPKAPADRRQQEPAGHRCEESDRAREGQPGKLSFAIGSTASAGHLSTELLRRAGGIDYLIVPWDLRPRTRISGGQIDGFIDPILDRRRSRKRDNCA